MKTKVAVMVAVALIAFGLKRHYAEANTDALSWILTPTAQVVGAFTGVAFAAVPGEGYFSAERMFLIEKACAGVNFMIAALAMVAAAVLHRARSLLSGAAVVGVSLLASYVSAIVVNTMRIVAAMWLAAHPPTWTSLSAAEVHRLEGIAVYFGGLLLLYALVRRIDSGRPGFGYALPLGCYYAVTLGIPLLNGAYAGQAFVAHSAIVLLVPPVLILVVVGARRLLLLYPRRRSISPGSSAQPKSGTFCGPSGPSTARPSLVTSVRDIRRRKDLDPLGV
jgi:exosortase K